MHVNSVKKIPVTSNTGKSANQVSWKQVPTIPPRTQQSRLPSPIMAGHIPSNAELAQQIAALTAVVINLANAIADNQAPPAAAAPSAASVSFATSLGVAAVEELVD